MPSKLITNRLRLALAVDAAVMPNLDTVNPALAAYFDPLLEEGETLPDFGLMQKLLGRALIARHGELIEVDKVHLEERADDNEPRLTRDRAAEELRRKMFALRSLAEGTFGAERSGEVLALQGQPISSVPDILWRQAKYTLERLEDPDYELPEVVFGGSELDRTRLAAELRPAVEALGAALSTVAMERRKLDKTHDTKVDTMTHFDHLFSASTRILEGFYLIAEGPRLAERVRPTTIRRRSKAARDAEREELEREEEAPAASPPSDAPPTVGETPDPSLNN